MTKLASKVVLALCVLVCMCSTVSADPIQTFVLDNYATAPSENASGYGFTYLSQCESPGTDDDGNTYYDWWYVYYLENNSLDQRIVSWTWTDGAFSGPLMPGNHENVFVVTNTDDDNMPLPSATGTGLDTAYFRNEDFTDFDEKVQIQSVIHWEDGHTAQVPVYVPSGYRETMGGSPVPEPGSLLAISSGLIGLVGLVRRRRA